MMWVALAGGVGGAKLARGLAALTPETIADLRIVVNTADDFTLHGLHISPDVDTLLYTLGGIANSETGWGIMGDTTMVLDQLRRLGQETWFWLGDRDLATHITRTAWLHEGVTLAEVTHRLASALGIAPEVQLLPMSNDPVMTEVETPDGWLAFQDYFVRRHHADPVQAVRFAGMDAALPLPAALEAIERADVIVLCPSNPIVSIGPILALPGMRAALAHHGGTRKRVAISPIIGGQALKGPADRMLEGLGSEVSSLGVARLYEGLIDLFIIDTIDAALAPEIEKLGMQVLITNTIMRSLEDSRELAMTITQAVGV